MTRLFVRFFVHVQKGEAMTLSTHKLSHNGYSDALSYDRLEEPWRQWAQIARNFSYQLDDHRDREDLMHNIIVRLAEVAGEYYRQGKSLTKGGCIRVAQYTRLRFYHQKERWRRVSLISLNSVVQDEDGNETEMIQTIAAKKEIGTPGLTLKIITGAVPRR